MLTMTAMSDFSGRSRPKAGVHSATPGSLFAKRQKPWAFSYALHTTPKKAHRIFSAKSGNLADPFPFGGKQYGPKTELT